MRTRTVILQIKATYDEFGRLLSFSPIPEDLQRINITVDEGNPSYKGQEYRWGLGTPKELMNFLRDPNSF
jgi:hypothetical protein